MKKIEVNAKDIISLLITLIIGALIIGGGLLLIGNQSEVYNDFVIEIIAQNGSNMSGEIKVFWCTLFIGLPILFFLQKKMKTKKEDSIKIKEDSFYLKSQIIINIANLIYFLFRGNIFPILFLTSILLFINHLINPKKEKEGLVLPIIIYYFLLSCYTLINFVGFSKVINNTIFYIITFIIDIVIFLIDKRKSIINKCIAGMQIFIPFLLLYYVRYRYIYKGNTIYIQPPLFSILFYGGIILFMLLYSLLKTKKEWKNINKKELKDILLITTCLVLFVFNSFQTNTALIVSEDLHHTGENVMGYQQIFEKGQMPYTDYSPVSGMYSVFMGFFLYILGDNFAAVNLATTIFLTIIAFLTMYFLSKHLNKEDCLFVSILFSISTYNRMAFILLSLLILFLPKLIEKKNLWLKVWIWLCFIGGLYYPTYGVAVLVGTLPLGIKQFIDWIKAKEWKKEKVRFWIGWIITLIPIFICLPLLLKMAKHILMYSSQTVLSEGIAVFGQDVPTNFLPYLSNYAFIRTILYYILRYLIPVAFLWLFVLFFIKAKQKTRWKDFLKTESFFQIVACILILLVGYSFVIIRNDKNMILARSGYLLILIGGIVCYLIIKKYFKKTSISYSIIGIIFGIFLITDLSGLNRNAISYSLDQKINDNYVLIDNDIRNKYANLKDGFISSKTLEIAKRSSKAYELLKYDPNLKFLAWNVLGIYNVLDLTTVGQPSITPVKSREATDELIEAIENQKPVIGLYFSATYNQYLYNYLLLNEDYVFDNKYEVFMPKELFYKIYGENTTLPDKVDISVYDTELKKISNSLGKSMNSLKERLKSMDIKFNISLKKFENMETDYDVNLEKEVYGVDANYLYVKFDLKDELKKYESSLSWRQKLLKQNYFDKATVEIRWGGGSEDKITSTLGDGELLIPLNVNANWLLNNHEKFTITIKNMNNVVKIEKLEFYKLEI